MSAAISLSMSPREVVLLSTHGYHTHTSLYHLKQPEDFLVEKTTCCRWPRMLGFGCLGKKERTLVDTWLKWVRSRDIDLQWRVHPLTCLHNAFEGVLVLLVKSNFSPPFLSCTSIINLEKLTKRDSKNELKKWKRKTKSCIQTQWMEAKWYLGDRSYSVAVKKCRRG